MAVRFNAPPGWPAPPLSWAPSEDWLPDPEWPEPPEGWSFWSPVLEGAGSLSVADRAALEAELDAAQPSSYGCTVVGWWTAAGEVSSPVASPPQPAALTEVVSLPPVPATHVVSRPAAPGRRTATVPRRGVLIAAVILCALGLVGFQASRILFVSDDSGTQEVPKPLPVSDTRDPSIDSSSRASTVQVPAGQGTTARTDRPELVAATVTAPASASTSTTVVSSAAPTTTAPASAAPATERRTGLTSTAAPVSRSSDDAPAGSATVLAQPSVTTSTKSVVPATATAVPAGGDGS